MRLVLLWSLLQDSRLNIARTGGKSRQRPQEQEEDGRPLERRRGQQGAGYADARDGERRDCSEDRWQRYRAALAGFRPEAGEHERHGAPAPTNRLTAKV